MTDIAELVEETVLVQLRVNGQPREVEVHGALSLLDLLRDDLRLTGTHMGCQTGHCGACTVLIDGRVAKACITPAATLRRAEITTVEGLAAADGTLHPVQQAFWDEAGFQCGYCSPGFLLATVELLKANPDPTDDDLRQAYAGNLCRCTGYQSILRAARAAATRVKEQGS
jgi:aerobic-type carbon monoxide dehydrogenase small subunit (CoxS/CutS family)